MATGLIKLSQAFQTLLTSTPEKTSLMLRPGDVHGSSLLLSPLDRIAHWKDCLAAGIGFPLPAVQNRPTPWPEVNRQSGESTVDLP